MAFQLYLVQPKVSSKIEVLHIAEFIVRHNGIVLMVTKNGSLIVGFDDQLLQTVKKFHSVEFVGPVTIDPNGLLAKRLAKFLNKP